MRREYNNVRVELLKIRGKYIPSAFYVDQKLYEIEEILSIRKGMVQCGTPGIRYFVKAHGQETELLFDNGEKRKKVGGLLYMTRRWIQVWSLKKLNSKRMYLKYLN